MCNTYFKVSTTAAHILSIVNKIHASCWSKVTDGSGTVMRCVYNASSRWTAKAGPTLWTDG